MSNAIAQQFDDYRRAIDEGYKEVQRFLATGDHDSALEYMEASVDNQTLTLGNLRIALNK